MTLSSRRHGRVGSARVVLVHGFTQNQRCWSPLLEALADRFSVVTVDAPGHGESPARHDQADLGEAARLIGEVGGCAHYVGYSMGGRMCLRLACDRPELVQSLTLIGATPGLRDETQRADRRRADDALAGQLERDGLSPFLEHWLALPLFSGLSEERQARAERLANRAEGVAASLRRCGTGAHQAMWDRLAGLDMAVLVMAGQLDAKFAAIATEMVAAINASRAGGRPVGRAELRLVPDAGHTLHLEQPSACAALLVPWIERLAQAG